MNVDIIIYAIVAVLVFARLWSILGQRNSEDRERPNPFATPPNVKTDPTASNNPAGEAQIETLVPVPPKPILLAPNSLAGGLMRMKETDPSFDEKQFLQGARAAFTLILDNFAKGDLSDCTRLLGPTVLPHFRSAIEARRAASQTMEHKLVNIREAECTAAKVENGQAVIAVRFVSEQESTLRDAKGQIVGGHEGQVEEITDLWTFARDIKSSDPNWVLVETRS